MKSFIRYRKHNGTLHIGGQNNKLSMFIAERSARLQIGNKVFHFGKLWG